MIRYRVSFNFLLQLSSTELFCTLCGAKQIRRQDIKTSHSDDKNVLASKFTTNTGVTVQYLDNCVFILVSK